MMTLIKRYLNANWQILLSLLILVSASQFVLAPKQLQMGFFTDDWLFLSAYRAYINNPILDLLSGWKALGAHWFPHSYYLGVLYNFFGFDYFSYRLFNQLLKIVATLSLYPLVLNLSNRKLLAFLASLIYGIHFSTFGALDGPSRGEDFLAVISMNLFLASYLSIIKRRVTKPLVILGFAIWLAVTIMIDDTRMFPLMLVVFLGDIFYTILGHKTYRLQDSFKRIFFFSIPFFAIFIFSPGSVTLQLTYPFGRLDKLVSGNWQLFLAPFAAYGSTFIAKEWLILLGNLPYQTLATFVNSYQGPLFTFLVINLLLSTLTPNPLRYLIKTFILNSVFALVAYLLSNHWLSIPPKDIAPVDPGTYLTPAIVGLNFLAIAMGFLDVWQAKRNNYYLGIFVCSIFSITFIYLTWVFADINSIFMGVHPYLNIPAMGTSIYISLILTLFYDRFRSSFWKWRFIYPASMLLVVVIIFWQSIISVDQYFSRWLTEGVKAEDQIRIQNQFWDNVHYQKTTPPERLPITYLDTSEDYPNGSFYSEVIIWRLSAWFDLKYNQPKEGRYSLCELMIIDRKELEASVKLIDGKKRLVRDKCGPQIIYSAKDFYAFKLTDRNLHPNRLEVLKELGVEE